MAISFDAASSGSIGSSTNVSFIHTTSGADRALFVGFLSTAGGTVSSVTYNGVTMSQIDKVSNVPTGNDEYSYFLINPALGANTLSITFTTSVTILVHAVSYNGVKQTGQPEQHNTGTSSAVALTVNVTTTSDNTWLVAYCRNGAANISAGAGMTLRDTASSEQCGDSNGALTPAGSHGLQMANATSQNVMLLISLAPSGVATNSGNFFQFMN